VVRDCVLRRGRGNPRLAVAFAGPDKGHERPSAIHDVVFEGNKVWGDFSMVGVDGARVEGNEWLEKGASSHIERCTPRS
jgi:hypothetical protein